MMVIDVEKRFTSAIICGGRGPKLRDVFRIYSLVRRLRPQTEDTYWRRLFPVQDWLDIPITGIKEPAIIGRLYWVAFERGPAAALNLYRLIRALFNFASAYYEYPDLVRSIDNPCSRICWRGLSICENC